MGVGNRTGKGRGTGGGGEAPKLHSQIFSNCPAPPIQIDLFGIGNQMCYSEINAAKKREGKIHLRVSSGLYYFLLFFNVYP